MGRASQKFDRELFNLKLSELSHQLQTKSAVSDRKAAISQGTKIDLGAIIAVEGPTGRAASRQTGSFYLMDIVNGQLALLRDEWLMGVDRIAREVWQTQRETITPEFVRDVLLPEAMTLIGARESTVKANVAGAAQRTHLEDPHDALHHLAMEIRKLHGQVGNRYEIEARELEYRSAPTQGLPRQAQRPTSQSVDQRENLRDGILKKKSRIAEIERILDRPPLTEHRGRPVHGGENWRLRLEEEKQHVLIAVTELEAELERQCEALKPIEGRSEWQGFHNRFMQLANEEERIERTAPKDRLLRAYCDYKKHPEIWAEKGKPEQGFVCLLKAPETGLWMLSDGVSENFLERFRALAARAGVALSSPKGTDPEDFWLHRLYHDLLENNSDQLFAASKEGGVILRVCEASATFCSRLERKAVTGADHLRTGEKQAESSRVQNSAKSTRELPAPVAQSPEQGPLDWHEELRRAGKMDEDIGHLNYFRAWDDVRQLAQTNDAIEREKRIGSLWRLHPEAAEKLGLPKLQANNVSQSAPTKAEAAEGKSKNAALDPSPKDEKAKQDNAEAEFADVLASGIGGRRGGLDLKRSLFTERDSWIRRAVPKRGNRGGKRKAVKGEPKDHRAMVEAYIEEGRKKGKRITKKDIWTAAGYRTRTEFERWERQDPKRPNKAADKNFTRVLREKQHLK